MVVSGVRSWLFVEIQQLVDRHLGRAHRIVHREDAIVGNFDELTS